MGDYVLAYCVEQFVKALAILAVVLGVGLFATWRWQPWTMRRDIDRLEQRIEQLEKQEPTDAP